MVIIVVLFAVFVLSIHGESNGNVWHLRLMTPDPVTHRTYHRVEITARLEDSSGTSVTAVRLHGLVVTVDKKY